MLQETLSFSNQLKLVLKIILFHLLLLFLFLFLLIIFIFLLPCLQVTSLTALKFAELTVRAGFPKGVINILPGKGQKHTVIYTMATELCTYCVVGTGSVIGQALTDHVDVRKVGFTGSTDIGKEIMKW